MDFIISSLLCIVNSNGFKVVLESRLSHCSKIAGKLSENFLKPTIVNKGIKPWLKSQQINWFPFGSSFNCFSSNIVLKVNSLK